MPKAKEVKEAIALLQAQLDSLKADVKEIEKQNSKEIQTNARTN